MRLKTFALWGSCLASAAGATCLAADSAPFPPFSVAQPDLPPRPDLGTSGTSGSSVNPIPSGTASTSSSSSTVDPNRSTASNAGVRPPFPPPPPIAEETVLPIQGPPKCCLNWLNPFMYLHYTANHGARDRHHGRQWFYVEEQRHGFPYGCTPYEGRAAGASYTFGQWGPRRSFYYAYQPGGYNDLPYGYSAEPYYNPRP